MKLNITIFSMLFASVFSGTAMAGEASVYGIVLGDDISTVLEKHPDAIKAGRDWKVRTSKGEKVIAKGTKGGVIYRIRFIGQGMSCSVIIDKLLSKYPSNEGYSNSTPVLANKFWEWTSGSDISVGLTTCGKNKVNIHITDNSVVADARAKKKSQEDAERSGQALKAMGSSI